MAAPLPDDSIPRIVKSRRYKSSQIPLQPVEMPSYMVDSLQLKVMVMPPCNFDVFFVSLSRWGLILWEPKPCPPIASPLPLPLPYSLKIWSHHKYAIKSVTCWIVYHYRLPW